VATDDVTRSNKTRSKEEEEEEEETCQETIVKQTSR